MEIGAVIAAAPQENVRRETPQPGDVVILLGGSTGRDGIGGATGSSKAHNVRSVETCGAEVQKGNAPEERKLQRLFRNAEASRMIKRCNDFGAGGVSVAIGELAEGLDIDLNAVPRKYDGLDGTELAISESQERMAVVLAKEDVSTLFLPTKLRYQYRKINSKLCVNLLKINNLINYTFGSKSCIIFAISCKKDVVKFLESKLKIGSVKLEFRKFYALMPQGIMCRTHRMRPHPHAHHVGLSYHGSRRHASVGVQL